MSTINVRGPFNDIAIAAVYCPPKHNLKANQFEKFSHSLGKTFIARVDFNSKSTLWGSRLTTKGRELEKVLQANNYAPLSAGSPTYWPTDIHKIPDLHGSCCVKEISIFRMRNVHSVYTNLQNKVEWRVWKLKRAIHMKWEMFTIFL